MMLYDFLLVFVISTCFVSLSSQQDTDLNGELKATNNATSDVDKLTEKSSTDENILIPDVTAEENQTKVRDTTDTKTNDNSIQITTQHETTNCITRFYIALKKPIIDFIEEPRVNTILKNIGTCIVNGAMEIISYYFPAPLIPLIASAAGTMIPFEPVVMLRKRMPVTSYRRAFNKAVNSFMGTFDRFKTSEEDPYMTRRFNRRFMQDNSAQVKDKE